MKIKSKFYVSLFTVIMIFSLIFPSAFAENDNPKWNVFDMNLAEVNSLFAHHEETEKENTEIQSGEEEIEYTNPEIPDVSSEEVTTFEDRESVILPDCKKDGFILLGWNTNKDGSGTMYQPGDEFFMPADTNSDLFAIWEPVEESDDQETEETEEIEEPEADKSVAENLVENNTEAEDVESEITENNVEPVENTVESTDKNESFENEEHKEADPVSGYNTADIELIPIKNIDQDESSALIDEKIELEAIETEEQYKNEPQGEEDIELELIEDNKQKIDDVQFEDDGEIELMEIDPVANEFNEQNVPVSEQSFPVSNSVDIPEIEAESVAEFFDVDTMDIVGATVRDAGDEIINGDGTNHIATAIAGETGNCELYIKANEGYILPDVFNIRFLSNDGTGNLFEISDVFEVHCDGSEVTIVNNTSTENFEDNIFADNVTPDMFDNTVCEFDPLTGCLVIFSDKMPETFDVIKLEITCIKVEDVNNTEVEVNIFNNTEENIFNNNEENIFDNNEQSIFNNNENIFNNPEENIFSNEENTVDEINIFTKN